MSETKESNNNGKRTVTPDKAEGVVSQKKQKTSVTATTSAAVICACCKEEKENSPEQFYKKQRQAIKATGTGVCRTCWDRLGEKGRQQYMSTDQKQKKEEQRIKHQKRQKQEEERKRKRREHEEREKKRKERKKQEHEEREKKRKEREKQEAKNREDLNRALATKPRKCSNCHGIKVKEQFSATQFKVGAPDETVSVCDEKYGRIPKGLVEYTHQEIIVVGKCLECYPREEEERDIAAESRRLKIKSLHDDLQANRKMYNEQLEAGEINYGYTLWDEKKNFFMPYSPESIVGTYDIIYVALWGNDERENKTLKDATLKISQDGNKIRGTVEGRGLSWGDFDFEGNENDFTVVEHGWDGLYMMDEPDTTCNLDVFADRVACRWTPYGSDDDDSPVPRCGTVEEANAFIAQQQTVIDPNQSWIHNHLELPATAVSLIHEYAKAWTPPRPFFFFEKGDLRVKVVWTYSPREGACESQYVARKRPTTK